MAAVDPADDNPLLRMADLADEVAFLRKSIIELAPLIPGGYCCTVDEDEALIVLRELKARMQREEAAKTRWAKASTMAASTKSSGGVVGWTGAGESIVFPSGEIKVTLNSEDPASERGSIKGARMAEGWYDEATIDTVTSSIDSGRDAIAALSKNMEQSQKRIEDFEKILKSFTTVTERDPGDLYD